MAFDLTGEDIVLLALIGTGIVQLFSVVWVGLFKQPKPTEGMMRVIVFVVAVVWAYFATEIEFPAIEDPMQLAIALLEYGMVILVVAHNAYEVILKPVLEWVDAKVLGGRTVLAP